MWILEFPHNQLSTSPSPRHASLSLTMPFGRRTERIVRVRTGCLTCRRRKKKCDEARPICGGCVRNDLGCSWPTTIPGKRNSTPKNDERARSAGENQIECLDPSLDYAAASVAASPERRHSSASIGGQSAIISDSPQDTAAPDETADRRFSTIGNTVDSLLPTVSVGNVVPRTLSMLPGYDAESYSLLSHYLSTTADCMANGSTPVNPFLVQIVPLAFTSDLLLQLVITQSAAHRAFRRGDDTDAVAHTHYTKAIQLFRRGVTEFIDGKEPNPLILLVGALLMCFTEVSHHYLFATGCLRRKDRERRHDRYNLRSPVGRKFPTGQAAVTKRRGRAKRIEELCH